VIRTGAWWPKANAAISRSWGSGASSMLISGRTAPHWTMFTWKHTTFIEHQTPTTNKPLDWGSESFH
jgi:hypothetical protein